MCDKVKTAIELIKTQKKRALTKEEIVVLFQQVASDLGKQGERMTNLEKELSAFKEETRNGFNEVNSKLHELIELVKTDKKPTFWERIPLLGQIPTWFWIILWTIIIIIGALLGVSPDFIKYIQHGG